MLWEEMSPFLLVWLLGRKKAVLWESLVKGNQLLTGIYGKGGAPYYCTHFSISYLPQECIMVISAFINIKLRITHP